MKIDRNDLLYRQLQAYDPRLDMNRLIPVGPHELESMIGDRLGLSPGWIDVPEFPYSLAQLRTVAERLAFEEEQGHAVLTLDLPEIAGKPTDLYHLAEWFGYSEQQASFGRVRNGLLNLNVHLSRGEVEDLSQQMGTVTSVPRWRIRYLTLPRWSQVSGYANQVQEVQKRGLVVPEAIADCWSMLITRLFQLHCDDNEIFRSHHSGSTATLFRGHPIVVYNLQYRFGLVIDWQSEPDSAGTHACCEVPPTS